MLETVGDISSCDHSTVELTAKTAKEMIRMSIEAFSNKDVDLARNIEKMDDYVDDKYRSCISSALNEPSQDTKCVVSTTLIMRYLERIADHSAYIGESVVYTVTGEKSPRK